MRKKSEQTFAEMIGSFAGEFAGVAQAIAQTGREIAAVSKAIEQMAINMKFGAKSEDQLMRERVASMRKRSLRLKAKHAVDGFREFIRRR